MLQQLCSTQAPLHAALPWSCQPWTETWAAEPKPASSRLVFRCRVLWLSDRKVTKTAASLELVIATYKSSSIPPLMLGGREAGGSVV